MIISMIYNLKYKYNNCKKKYKKLKSNDNDS